MGSFLPMVVGLAAVPLILEKLGLERFGLLTLAWLIVGYFSLFDFGLGRALTKIIAEYVGARREEEVPQVFWTSMALMLALSILGAILFWFLAPSLVNILSVSLSHRGECRSCSRNRRDDITRASYFNRLCQRVRDREAGSDKVGTSV